MGELQETDWDDCSIDKENPSLPKSPVQPESAEAIARYVVVAGYISTLPEDFAPSESFDTFLPRFSISLLTQNQFKTASTGMQNLDNAPPALLGRTLIVLTWSERVVRAVLNRDTSGVKRWELLGWKREIPKPGLRHVIAFVRVWVEPPFEIHH